MDVTERQWRKKNKKLTSDILKIAHEDGGSGSATNNKPRQRGHSILKCKILTVSLIFVSLIFIR